MIHDIMINDDDDNNNNHHHDHNHENVDHCQRFRTITVAKN